MTGRILWFATVLLLTWDGTVSCETLTPSVATVRSADWSDVRSKVVTITRRFRKYVGSEIRFETCRPDRTFCLVRRNRAISDI
jgi:hypothetical protein